MLTKYSMTHLEILETSFFSSKIWIGNIVIPYEILTFFYFFLWYDLHTHQIMLMTHFFINWSLAFSICRMQRFWKVPNSIESTLLWNSLISINRRPLNKQNKILHISSADLHVHQNKKRIYKNKVKNIHFKHIRKCWVSSNPPFLYV